MNRLKAEPSAAPPQQVERLLYVCFFLSGAAGLIYQVSWMKALTLIFGRTTYAITAVLAAFMAGLALGSWLWGRFADRARHLLRAYAFIELGIASTGLATLFGLKLSQSLYTALYPPLAEHSALLLAYRFAASFLLLLVPTTLMGGTYPLVVRYLTRSREELANRASRLYWLNTLGAVVGASAAGFVLLAQLGLRRTLLIAVGLNLVVGLLVLASSVRLAVHLLEAEKEREVAAPAPRFAGWILFASGVSGLTSMMFEIGWTRLLGIFVSSTTYAFTLMLATFLFGISLGSYWFERRHPRWSLGPKLLGELLVALALSAVLFLAMTTELAELTRWMTRTGSDSPLAVLGTQFLVSFLAIILPTILFGLIFPLTVVLYCGGNRQRGTRAGTLYAVNTVGAIAGACLTGFWLIRWLGTVNTLLLAIGLNLAVATALFGATNPRSWRRVAMGFVLLVALGTAAARGVFAQPLLYGLTLVANWVHPVFLSPLTAEEIARQEEVLFAEEGINTTVVVGRSENELSLRTGGKSEAGTGDTPTQTLLAYVPLALHPQPRRMLVIGFGSGATVYAASQFANIERIDCVEIEPAVLRAAPYMAPLNHGVYRSPRVRLIVDDARNFLFVSRERYDAIVSEPSYLWSAGIASLFTREFYLQVREHLEPGGLFLQWVQAYQMASRDFRTVLRTLTSVFGQVSLWRGSRGDFLVLAGRTPARFTLEPLAREYRRNPGLRAVFEEGLKIREPAGLVGYFLLNDAEVRELAAGADLNTDDRPVLEYRAPHGIPKLTGSLNQALVRMLRREVLPQFVEIPDRAGALLAGAETQIRIGMLAHVLGASLVPELVRVAPNRARTYMVRAAVARHEGEFLAALDYLQRAEALDPTNPQIAFQLGRLYAAQGQDDLAEQALGKCLRLSPNHVEALQGFVSFAMAKQRWDRALVLEQRVLARGPDPLYLEWSRLGEIHLARGENQFARDVFQKVLDLEPMAYAALRNLAALAAQEGNAPEAIRRYKDVIRYHPQADPQVYLHLGSLYRQAGLEAYAQQVLRKARRLFPNNPYIEQALWRM